MSKQRSLNALRGEPFVEVTRGGFVESVHEVAACALDARENVAFALGDEQSFVFLRSSAKPFIAGAIVAAGAQERFGFDEREIAIMAGSHAGQPFHVAAVASILEKTGMPQNALQCGIHPPYNAAAARELEAAGEQPSVLHNNCSGKHAGILALCKILDADPSTYLQASNGAQVAILDFCARVSGMRAADFEIAVDGCGIPVYALPLRNAALSYLRLATLRGLGDREANALKTVRNAMIAYPEYMSGTGEFDARLMRAANGSVACKGGAEGVHGTAALASEIGLVCKVVDGTARGRAPAVLAILRDLRVLSGSQSTELADLERPMVYNRAGREVGEISARASS